MPKLFDNGTNTQGVIVYGGVDSSNYGIVVGESPAFERPNRKQTIIQVPGRNGSVLFQENAWEDVTRTYSVWLDEDIANNKTLADKVDKYEAALNSLNGYQELTDNFEPDVYRLAYYSGGDSFSTAEQICVSYAGPKGSWYRAKMQLRSMTGTRLRTPHSLRASL